MTRIIFRTPIDSVRLETNDINQDADGGRIVLMADSRDLGMDVVEGPEKLSQFTQVLNYRADPPMEKWPLTRLDRATRKFTAILFEGLTQEQMEVIEALVSAKG